MIKMIGGLVLCFALVSCGDGGSGGDSALDAYVGVWGDNDIYNGEVDISYLEINSDGEVWVHDYEGDAWGGYVNCYERYYSSRLEHVGGDTYVNIYTVDGVVERETAIMELLDGGNTVRITSATEVLTRERIPGVTAVDLQPVCSG